MIFTHSLLNDIHSFIHSVVTDRWERGKDSITLRPLPDWLHQLLKSIILLHDLFGNIDHSYRRRFGCWSNSWNSGVFFYKKYALIIISYPIEFNDCSVVTIELGRVFHTNSISLLVSSISPKHETLRNIPVRILAQSFILRFKRKSHITKYSQTDLLPEEKCFSCKRQTIPRNS